MKITPIHVFAKWQVKADELYNALALLDQVAKKSREEEGNLFYTVNQSSTDPNTLILFEGYKNDEALEYHRSSEHFKSIVIEQIVPLLAQREVILTKPL